MANFEIAPDWVRVQYPENAGIGVVILLVGVAVYWLWVRQASPHKEV